MCFRGVLIDATKLYNNQDVLCDETIYTQENSELTLKTHTYYFYLVLKKSN